MDTLIKRKSNDLDIKEFNIKFNKLKEETKEKNRIMEEENIKKQNITQKNILDFSLKDTLIGIKDTWFDLMNDILNRNFTRDILLKNNRLYYIGLTLIIIVLLFYIFDFIIEDSKNDKSNKIIYNIYTDNKNLLRSSANNLPALLDSD